MRPSHSIFLAISILLFGTSCNSQTTVNKIRQPSLLPAAVEVATENHLSAKPWTQELCDTIVQQFLDELDEDRLHLTRVSINEWQALQELLFRDMAQGESLLVEAAHKEINAAGLARAAFYKQLLPKHLDLDSSARFESNPERRDRPKDGRKRTKEWKRHFHWKLLEQLTKEVLIAPEKELQILKKRAFTKVQQRLIERAEVKANMDLLECAEALTNAYLQVQDYQSYYMSPQSKSDWQAEYTRQFVGIGARLEIENDYPKITELLVGSPAWKQGQLKEGDIILTISDGSGEMKDVGGLAMNEIVALLKGPEGSSVQLLVAGTANTSRQIKVPRGQVELETASSFMLSDSLAEQPIGYLRLPRFYMGDEGSAWHVLQELEALNELEAQALILDLRFNRGGSAREAAQIIGFFLEDAVAMQSRYKEGDVSQITDDDGKVVFDGELLIMVNGRSSSASELTSGTLQDYKRALIVGSPQTFGKGSIQQFFDLEVEDSLQAQPGQVKLTVGNFFTASGRSPQYNGIAADIVLPDGFGYIRSGERTGPFALPPVSLDSLINPIQNVNLVEGLDSLRIKSETRVASSDHFNLAVKRAERLAEQEKATMITLNYKKFLDSKKNDYLLDQQLEEIEAPIEGFHAELVIPENRGEREMLKLRRQRLVEQIQSDPYIQECLFILNDML